MINMDLKEKLLEQAVYQVYKTVYDVYRHPTYPSMGEPSKEDRIKETIASINIPACLSARMEQTLENISAILSDPITLFPQDLDAFHTLRKEIEAQATRFAEKIESNKESIFEMTIKLSEFTQFNGDVIHALCQYEYGLKSILSLYNDFLYSEKSVAAITMKDWNSKLTPPASYQVGKPFYFVAHATRSDAEDVQRYIYSRNLISTSLLSDVHTDTYQSESREYGLIYSPCLENIFLISKGDAYCDDLPNVDFHFGAEYICKGAEICSIWYTDPNACRTYLIAQLENDHPEKYNEIVLLNNEYSRPTAIFRLEPCSEFAQEQSAKLADIMHLKLLILPKSTE